MRILRSPWSPIGVDVGGRYISAAQLRRQGSRRPRLEAGVSIRRRDPDVPIDPKEIASFATVLERQGFRGRDIVTAVPTDQVMMDVVEVPQTSNVRTERLVRAELAKRHSWAEQKFELASWPLSKGHGDGGIKLMAVACPHKVANPFLDAFEQAGLHVRALDMPSWALARLTAPIIGAAEELYGVVNLGWDHASLIVLHGGVVVYVRTLNNVALNRLHMSICSRLDLDEELSEHVVEQLGLEASAGAATSPRLQNAQRQLTTFTAQLVTELEQSLSYLAHEFPYKTFRRLMLVGEGARIRGLGDRLSESLRVDEIAPLVPADVVDCNETLSRRCGEPLLSTAVGLATW